MVTSHKIEELVEKLQRLAKFALEDCDCGICVQCRHAEAMDGAAQTIKTLMRENERLNNIINHAMATDPALQGVFIARQALSKETGE